MHCCILKCTFQHLSTYRAQCNRIYWQVLHEFNYVPPDKIQGQIIKFLEPMCPWQRKWIYLCMYRRQTIKATCVRAEWKPFDVAKAAKKKKSLKHKQYDSSTDCAICLYECVDNVRLECEHDFCYKCIKKWLSIKRTCPVCDAKVSFETHKQRKRLRLRRKQESKWSIYFLIIHV